MIMGVHTRREAVFGQRLGDVVFEVLTGRSTTRRLSGGVMQIREYYDLDSSVNEGLAAKFDSLDRFTRWYSPLQSACSFIATFTLGYQLGSGADVIPYISYGVCGLAKAGLHLRARVLDRQAQEIVGAQWYLPGADWSELGLSDRD